MSKQAQKKGTKDGGKTVSAPTPAATHDIIPGKFTDYDWNMMLDADDGDDFAEDIIGELMTKVMDECQQRHIAKQLLPYTINMAKDAMLQIVEWRFLQRDEGELDCDTDPVWEEDSEPEPCRTDCWAQGSVPREETMLAVVIEEASEEQPSQITESEESLQDSSSAQTQDCIPQVQESDKAEELPRVAAELEESASSKTTPEVKHTPKPPLSGPGQSRRKIKWKPKRGKVQYDSLSNMHESMDQMEYRLQKEMICSQHDNEPTPDLHPMETMPSSISAFMKVQHGRPPAQRDVEYDHVGNVLNVSKISPDKLPTHTVRTRFTVIDPRVEEAKAELEALRHGKFSAKRQETGSRQPTTSTARQPLSKNTARSRHAAMSSLVQGSRNQDKTEAMQPGPTAMMDAMNIEPGVVVREGDRVRRGPKPLRRTDISKTPSNLVPVGNAKSGKPILVSAILTSGTPTIRPLGTSPIVPPISGAKQDSRMTQAIH